MHHVELLLDPVADAAVRDQWRALDDAGLPSQARHRSASNRPHVTLTVTSDWPHHEHVGPALAALAALPLEVTLGAPLVFGAAPFVLARLVVPTPALLDLHAGLVARMPSLASDVLAPGRWTPHVTLGRRLDAQQVAAALGCLGGAPPLHVELESARHWDSRARTDRPLAP